METRKAPRGVTARIRWFLDNNPSGVGMCAQHSWHSLGGDYGNPPRWGTAHANALYDKVKASGRWFTGDPPRGALIVWKYGKYGHAAIGYGDGKIATTDPQGRPGKSGVESITYPHKWGANAKDRIWTDQYNGVRFPVEATNSIKPGKVYLSKLRYGQDDSDSVSRLQQALNGHPLTGGRTLPVTGFYGDMTDNEVRLCQKQHNLGSDKPGQSFVGPKQAEHLFKGTGNTIVDDLSDPVDPPPAPDPPKPDPTPPPDFTGKHFVYHYGGKPAGSQVVPSKGYVSLDRGTFVPPSDGLLVSMLYANCEFALRDNRDDAGIRVRVERAAHDGKGVDRSAYQDFTASRFGKEPDHHLITHVWFEWAEGGRPVTWQVARDTAFTSVTMGTRYAKWVFVSKALLDALVGLMGADAVAGMLVSVVEDESDGEG